MPLKINGSSSGYTEIKAADAAANNTLTLPSSTGTLMTTGGSNTFTANQVIEVTDNTNAALRITQLGTGNALVVEDSTNPDSSPTVIDASGNVGIGTSSPSNKLVVNGAVQSTGTLSTNTTGTYLWYQSNLSYFGAWGPDASTNGTMAFYSARSDGSNGLERMRIDNGGNVLVGKTSVAATPGAELRPDGIIWSYKAGTTNSDLSYYLYSTGASAYRFYVGLGGTVYAVSTSISAISDQRLKENIRDLDIGLDAVLSLKPRKFDWKEGKGANIKNARGFIAQEFEDVFPDLIDEWADPAPEGEEPYKSVRQDLIPVLVKAIQELNAKVDAQAAEIADLKTRLTALEGGAA